VSDFIGDRAAAREEPGLIERARRFVTEDVWHIDLRPRTVTASAVRLLQLGVLIARGFVQDELLTKASALTYVTTLSLMPLLVVMVALISLVGGQQTIIDYAVDQLTAVSPDARGLILDRLKDVRIGSLGSLGGSLLLVTAILTLRHLEATLNGIWGVRQGRSWMRRFADYLAVLVVAPVLTAAAVSLATGLQSGRLFGELLEVQAFATFYDSSLRFLPQLLLVVAFTFLYWFFPNTRVRPLSALLGGVVATLLFSGARFAYVDLSVGAARYSVLFGGMVALPLILAWLYVCWAVVLLGAEVAFAHQNLAHYRRELRGQAPGLAEREAVALQVALAIARAFVGRTPPPEAAALSEALDIPVRAIRDMLESLEGAGIIVQCAGEDLEEAYVPGRPIHDITVSDVLKAARGDRRVRAAPALLESAEAPEGRAASAGTIDAAVARVLGDLDRALGSVGDAHTLADLLGSPRATSEPARA